MNSHSKITPTHHRVLLVEDDEISRICLRALLLQLGFEAIEAENGKQAVSCWQTQLLDLVLLDLHLPDDDGEDVLSRMLKTPTPARPMPPIIAVTTQVTPEYTDHLIQAGFTDYVLKPVTHEMLTMKIIHWLKPHNQVLELSRLITRHLQQHASLGVTLVRKLLADLPQQLDEIDSALRAGRKEEAVRIIHKLNGAAGFLGLADLHKYVDAMEAAMKGNNQSIQDAAWNQLKKEAQRLLTLGPELLSCLAQEANLNLSNRV